MNETSKHEVDHEKDNKLHTSSSRDNDDEGERTTNREQFPATAADAAALAVVAAAGQTIIGTGVTFTPSERVAGSDTNLSRVDNNISSDSDSSHNHSTTTINTTDKGRSKDTNNSEIENGDKVAGADKSPQSSHNTYSNSSSSVPGVEHVFFEEELEKMEQQTTDKKVIILAVDGGSHSELAFKFYKENVDRPGYYLHVLHHSDVWSHYNPTEGGPSADHCKEIAEKAKGILDKVAEKYQKLMEEYEVKGETVVLHGKDAWHDIIQHQEQTDALMIVMGTRGGGALARTFRGSCSDTVVHHSNVPVLVCCHPKN